MVMVVLHLLAGQIVYDGGRRSPEYLVVETTEDLKWKTRRLGTSVQRRPKDLIQWYSGVLGGAGGAS